MSDKNDERKPPAKRCYDEKLDKIVSDTNVEKSKKSRQEYYNNKKSQETKKGLRWQT